MAIDTPQREDSKGLRILAVDDDRQFLEALERWLASYEDAEVLTATNGAEALEAIDSSVDVLVCDRRMPERTGAEIVNQLNEEGYDIHTIVISAYQPDSALQEDDADLYLQKPINREELLEALDEVLSR